MVDALIAKLRIAAEVGPWDNDLLFTEAADTIEALTTQVAELQDALAAAESGWVAAERFDTDIPRVTNLPPRPLDAALAGAPYDCAECGQYCDSRGPLDPCTVPSCPS